MKTHSQSGPGFINFLCVKYSQSNLPPLCVEAPGRDSNPGWACLVAIVARTLTTRPSHLPVFFAPDFWTRGPRFESGISHNDPDSRQDHCVKCRKSKSWEGNLLMWQKKMREKIIFAPPALAPQYLVKVYTMSGMGLTVYSEG